MLKIYIGDLIPGLPYLPFLRPNLAAGSKVSNLFSELDAFSSISKPFFEITKSSSSADYLLIPHNYFALKDHPDVISHFTDLSRGLKKKIIIFALGDLNEHVPIGNSIIFRTSQYRCELKPNEVIVPAFSTDILQGRQISFRNKGDKAIVGFCGWAQFQTFNQKAKFLIKSFITKGAKKQGIYFRIKAMSVLAKSSLVRTNFLIRSSHYGNKKTITGDPIVARKEYINNILESDFVLAPKGDGNYSVRFYEALSLGRIPLLIDTDTPLPLENILRYDEFSLIVNYKDIKNLPEIISDYYSKMTNEKFILMQKKAREAYKGLLCAEAFFRRVFCADFLEKLS